MVAFHFPPLAGSSGIQRTLRFVQHLPAFGWQPLVLSAHPRVYEQTSDDLTGEIPDGTIVRRAFALDAARHLSIMGRYPGWMSRPDRWVSWKLAGVADGIRMIKEFKADAIWSTYPIATAHVIGAVLHRKSGIPWIADFRDPMAQDGYPPDAKTWESFKHIEERATKNARFSVFTTPGAARTYRTRYPQFAERIVVIENGFDEESFAAAGTDRAEGPLEPGTLIFLHSGIVYPEERDPRPLFLALRRLVASGRLKRQQVKFRFRAAVHEALLNRLAAENGVADFIEVCPPIPYKQALNEMMRADALLILQSDDCNDQIPAKLYEYLRARRPVLGLTDPNGDTAETLRRAGMDAIARLESTDEIEAILPSFIDAVASKTARIATTDVIDQASRKGRAESLSDLLNQCV